MGRTPWSAAGPPAGFLRRATKADEGVGRGPGGPPHQTEAVHFRHSHQNRNFKATCTLNGSPGPMPGWPDDAPRVDPMRPSELPTLALGGPRFTRLKMLNISTRN